MALVRCHQLVQRATREHPATRPTPESARAAADALLHAWPDIERDTGLGVRLRAHTRALRTRTSPAGSVEEWLWQPDGHPVLFRAGTSLGGSGQVKAAVGYWQEMARTAGHRLGPDHPHTLTTRHNLARWRGETGDPAGAANAFEHLLTDTLRILGPDHPHTLTTRRNLADWTYESGDTAKAVEVLSTLADDQERVLGPDHLDTQASKQVLRLWRDELSDG
ncbi:hypothetical protein BJF83_23545 [Nocardiopsis sp. CNR-923]|uniref:tetratricopeptide repeat protein n=1 Tax=Nocardiopsis sp. CNR-923 TaxID=1904965 RepID=UPI00095EAA88|nr:tetratricopeptide repeat protein [Nocardiopsis sp. CNR-923]OLT24907.1 hypothetical protein BJF83_23545 [Nocardiopsis sp. CNR-923]